MGVKFSALLSILNLPVQGWQLYYDEITVLRSNRRRSITFAYSSFSFDVIIHHQQYLPWRNMFNTYRRLPCVSCTGFLGRYLHGCRSLVALLCSLLISAVLLVHPSSNSSSQGLAMAPTLRSLHQVKGMIKQTM